MIAVKTPLKASRKDKPSQKLSRIDLEVNEGLESFYMQGVEPFNP